MLTTTRYRHNLTYVKSSTVTLWSGQRKVLSERIAADKEFFEGILDNIKSSFIYGMLPEIIDK